MRSIDSLSAEELAKSLNLLPHPEGGWYRETHRSDLMVATKDSPTPRTACTVIYFLLAHGQQNHWHRIDSDELWLWHAGGDMEISIAPQDAPIGHVTTQRIGSNPDEGVFPQAFVKVGSWQSARSLGNWSLVSCIVAPGFEWSGFILAPTGWNPSHPQPA